MSAERVSSDSLGGVTRRRVVVQCKHWLSQSVRTAGASEACAQMELWRPPVGDVYWAPYLVAALLLALLLAAATPVRPPPASEATRDVEQEASVAAVAIGVFFWIVLVLSLAAIALRYT